MKNGSIDYGWAMSCSEKAASTNIRLLPFLGEIVRELFYFSRRIVYLQTRSGGVRMGKTRLGVLGQAGWGASQKNRTFAA